MTDRRRAGRLAAALLLVSVWGAEAPLPGQAPPQAGSGGWSAIDYAALVDLRQPSHSGESVGMLLARLEGRPVPPPGERPADRTAHALLDPLIEPYGFVLIDALDALAPIADPPRVEVGSLWRPGEPQPAWAALLQARRYIVESDGTGRLRIILPYPESGAAAPGGGPPEVGSAAAALAAWEAAWPVLRHVLAAERRRLATGDESPPLAVEVHAYRPRPERLAFWLGTEPHRVEVRQTREVPGRRPFDPASIEAFLAAGLRPEGGRLERDGAIRLLGSQDERGPTLLGTPLSLADFAVAYRAVFHGGLAEPYMSLDRGYSPQNAIVNYGGRLRDTRLGWVSLLCDIRFKTMSQGLGIAEGRDLRAAIRERLGDFATHLERFAWNPASDEVTSQQTRLWFYPDDVDLTLSPEGDLLVMRRVRMTAASERVEDETLAPAAGEDPPWTRATVAAINEHYATLGELFPELDDLDTVVRLLSLFTWLRVAGESGLPLPDLDALLAVELPAAATPRNYPHLLAFNALPPAGSAGVVDVFDRVPVAEALSRLDPADGRPLPALQRYLRAVAALDATDPRNQQLIRELERYDPAQLNPSQLDILAHRAERVRMHQTVLGTLPVADQTKLLERQQRGERLRMFSVGIGGIDLGMGRALERARGRSRGLVQRGEDRPAAAPSAAAPPPAAAARASARRSVATASAGPLYESEIPLPPHGAGRERHGYHVRREAAGAGSVIETVYDADGPEARARRVVSGADGRAERFERFEEGRLLSYRLERQGPAWRARLVAPAAPRTADQGRATPEAEPPRGPRVPAGLVALRILPPGEQVAGPTDPVGLEWWDAGVTAPRHTALTRAGAQQLVLGRGAIAGRDASLARIETLPSGDGAPPSVMVLQGSAAPPWREARPRLPGETDPLRVAQALNVWWAGAGEGAPPHRAFVGTDPERSGARWKGAPGPGKRGAVLLLPEDAFPPPYADVRARLAAAWPPDRIATRLAEAGKPGTMVLLVSAEAPGAFAARLRALAGDPASRGRLLGAWSLTGPVRGDLPASLLAAGGPAAIGLAEGSVVGLREAPVTLSRYASALAGAADRRIEQIDGPLLWFF